MNFSRPSGTHSFDAGDPALKRRAIVGLSRWDERRRTFIPRSSASSAALSLNIVSFREDFYKEARKPGTEERNPAFLTSWLHGFLIQLALVAAEAAPCPCVKSFPRSQGRVCFKLPSAKWDYSNRCNRCGRPPSARKCYKVCQGSVRSIALASRT